MQDSLGHYARNLAHKLDDKLRELRSGIPTSSLCGRGRHKVLTICSQRCTFPSFDLSTKMTKGDWYR
jgi:hypothetical protein